MQVQYADGTITPHYDGRSHTWLRNFWNYLLGSISGLTSTGTTFGAGSLAVKPFSGTVEDVNYSTSMNRYLGIVAGAGVADCGIVLGSSTAAESFELYNLASPIPHGVSAGALSYAAELAPVAVYNAGTKTWTVTITRQFTNAYTAAVSVNETGLYYYNIGLNSYKSIFCRDKLPSTVTVPPGSILTVTYSLTLTFPA
jgi:hypothetical protein